MIFYSDNIREVNNSKYVFIDEFIGRVIYFIYAAQLSCTFSIINTLLLGGLQPIINLTLIRSVPVKFFREFSLDSFDLRETTLMCFLIFQTHSILSIMTYLYCFAGYFRSRSKRVRISGNLCFSR